MNAATVPDIPASASPARGGRRRWPAWGAAAAAYAALTVWATWPLPRGLGHHVVDPVALQGPIGWLTLADVLLVIWALAWDVHALATAPLGLFDANVFHPARWALARSDHFLGNLPLFAPVYLGTGNPVLAHQAVLLLTFPLSALAMCLAVEAWTGSLGAGFVAGLFFGLGPWRFVQLAHVQLLATLWLPLVLLLAVAVVARGGVARAAGLAVVTALQALCSVYLGVAAFTAAGAMILGAAVAGRAHVWRRGLAAVAALAIAAAVVLALSWPYIALGRLGAIPPVAQVVPAAGTPLELAGAAPLATYLLPHRTGSTRGYYFVGWTCAALAVAGALVRPRTAAARAGLVAVALVGWLVSLGYAWRQPAGGVVPLPLGWLAAVIPSLGSLRAPIRLGVVVAAALAALAGLGYARLEQLIAGRAGRATLALAVVTLALVELSPHRIPLRRVPVGAEVPPVYRWLAGAPPGPVLEVPVGFLDHDFLGDVAAVRWQSGYQYLSTVHWQPLLNGYSGYPPESFYLLMAVARRLPAPDAVQELVDLSGVRWVVVHRAPLGPLAGAWERVRKRNGLVRRAAFGSDLVFEVTLPPRRDLRPLLRAERPRPETLAGLSRAPLPPEALRAELDRPVLPRTMLVGGLQRGTVSVTNRGDRTWPGLDPVRDGLVGVSYRWRRPDGAPVDGSIFTRLARDLAPGETVRVPFGIVAPGEPGRYELVVTLRQDGGPWFDEAGVSAPAPVEVRAWPRRRTPAATP